MNLSLNEVEAMAKRAARGAGYPWGLAEEAGKATRWLCAQRVDGVAQLAGLLEQNLTEALEDHTPVATGSDWVGRGVLCPLITGALLSDQSGLLAAEPIRMQNLAVPALLLPFASSAARIRQSVINVISGGCIATTDGLQLAKTQCWPAHCDLLEVTLGGQITAPGPLATRATPDPASWETLGRFAHRTYAPATEQSRLLGAGAGLSDND